MDNQNNMTFEDITSSSIPKKGTNITKRVVDNAYSNIDKYVKISAFIVAIGTFLTFCIIAIILVMLSKEFTIFAIAAVLIGAVISLVLLFIIYGIGQVITQNNEILKRTK